MTPRRSAIGGLVALALALFACGVGGSKAQRAKILAELRAASPTGLDTGKLYEMYRLDSDFTDVQRDEMEKQIDEKIVEWKGMSVYEVDKSGDCYSIQTESGASSFPGTQIKACPPDGISDVLAKSLQTNSMISVKGRITGVFLRTIQIEPAIITPFE